MHQTRSLKAHDQSRVESLIGQVVLAGMPEHMRPDLERQAGALPDLLEQIVGVPSARRIDSVFEVSFGCAEGTRLFNLMKNIALIC